MFELADLLAGLQLEDAGDGLFHAPNMDFYGKNSGGATSAAVADIIAGGQLLSQAIVATSSTQPDKVVKSIHAVFARSGRVSVPLDLKVDIIQSGRTLSTEVVTFLQDDRAIATATVVLHAPDADVIRHEAPMTDVPAPGDPGVRVTSRGAYEMGSVASTELLSPDDVGPAELPTWVRFTGAPDDNAVSQALLAFVTNFGIIGVAMRPHAGLSAEQSSHVKVSTGVLTHTVSFHEPFAASDWLLLDQDSPYAGKGRCYGRGNVYTTDGALVASFSQEGLIRALAEPTGGHGKTATL
jgi:acyl-CoA thioesterase-2